MTDDLAGLGAGAPASGETPAAPPMDIEALKAQIKSELSAEYDGRISGLQTALNRKEAERRAAEQKAHDLELSGLTQEERDAQEWTQLQERLANTERENALLRLQREYPDLVPVYEQMIAAPDVKAQLDILATLRKQESQAAPPPQTPDPDQPPAPVDLNNPPSSNAYEPDTTLYNGQPMNMSLADQILARFTGPVRR